MSFSSPSIPVPRGRLSAALVAYLSGRSQILSVPPVVSRDGGTSALDDEDLQLALYCCYELHYRGFDGAVDAEWDDLVLRFRAALEREFEAALRDAVVERHRCGVDDPASELSLIVEDGDGAPSPSRFIAERGSLGDLREFAIHRSLYQLKEADGHTWAIPRYSGRSRSALIEIQMDEYGNGVPGQAHAELFADTMDELDLCTTYGAYVDLVGAPTLSTVNLLTWFELHRRLLPALLGHLAVFEMTSVVPMGRYASACDRLRLSARARRRSRGGTPRPRTPARCEE